MLEARYLLARARFQHVLIQLTAIRQRRALREVRRLLARE